MRTAICGCWSSDPCPKKLSDNWRTYKANYRNNPISGDRLRYDVLYHTDLSRSRGMSGELDLAKLNWSAYDLVVIDESHNLPQRRQQFPGGWEVQPL